MTEPRFGVLAVFAVLIATGCSPLAPAVDRVADGTTERGRYISHLSYAAYAYGAQLEALGQFEAAEESYQRAMAYDPDSWEIWTRLGAVRCAMKQADAKVAFSHAEALAPQAASLWLAEARCQLSRGQPARALQLAQRSLTLDPNHSETTHLISEALRMQGREAEARRWLLALAAREPGSHAAHIWLASADDSESGGASRVDLVDAALLDGRLELASSLALDTGLSEPELAAREVALGLTRQGFERAGAVFRADPTDTTAWVVLVVAADLLGQEDEYRRAMENADMALLPSDELSTLLLADLLKRRAGPGAAQAWLAKAAAAEDGAVQPAPPNDSLTSAVRTRLRAELALTSDPEH